MLSIINRVSFIFRRIRALLFFFVSGIKISMIGVHCKIKGHGLTIGKNVCIGDFCWIESVDQYFEQSFAPIIDIGDEVSMSDFVHISAIRHISIGSGTLIGSKVYIGDHSHGHYQDIQLWENEKNLIPLHRPLADEANIFLGKNCWIGDGVVILAGASIGNNCVIAANSVLKGSFPDNSIIAGVPAKLIKQFIE